MVRAIHEDSDSTAGGATTFTPHQATKMLPLVRRIVADVMKLSESISAQQDQIQGIDRLPETIEQVDYQEELRDIRGSMAEDEERLQGCLNELAALGIEVHFPLNGSVDFPALINRKQVRLCWHIDDEQVNHWHELGQQAKARKKIEPPAFGRETLN